MPMASRKKKSGQVGRIAFVALVALAVLAAAFLLVVRSRGQVSIAENAMGSLLTPVQNAVNATVTYVRDGIQGFRDRNNLERKYNLAVLELENAKMEIDRLEEAALENERLTTLLDAKERYQSQDPVYARVIAKEQGIWFDAFSINRGSLDGIAVNMAVITADGLVGRVIEVGLNYAKVLSLIDSRSAVACLVERTRDNGVMRGVLTSASTSSDCQMYYLPPVHDVVPGDRVLTSGVDSLYPKGIPVGTVTEVSRQPDGLEQYVVVAPLVDFLHLEEVLVLRTQVERAEDDVLPTLPDPAPRPQATQTVAPEATAAPVVTPDPNNTTWSYPTVQPTNLPAPATPEPGASGQLPEDAWAQDE